MKISFEPYLLHCLDYLPILYVMYFFHCFWKSLKFIGPTIVNLKQLPLMNKTMQWSNRIFRDVMNAFELFWKTLACTICWRTLIDDRTTKQKRLCSKAVQWPKVHTQATYYIPGHIHYTLFCFSKLTWFVIMLIHLVHSTATTKLIFRIPLLESQYILRNLYVQYKELELLLFYTSIEYLI